MNKIYDSKFLEVFLHKDNVLELKFKDQEMLELDFKNELGNSVGLMQKHRTHCNLWDLSSFTYAIDPELQNWIDTKINKAELESGVTHEAFLVPSDLAAQLSVEQTMDEIHGQHLSVKYFSVREDALSWLRAEAIHP